jgi:phosphatidylglycerophosphatase A
MGVVKESSDELNPPVATSAFVRVAPRRRTVGDYVALALATCGVGYLPLAPGTWGSLVGVGLYLLARAASARVFASAASARFDVARIEAVQTSLVCVLLILITLAGVWAATRAEKLLGRKDPRAVVIDEVAGQLIAFAFVPFASGAWVVVVGFVAFRLFDIWKPYPIRRLESLEAGLGIMADDVLAGFYAATLVALAASIRLLF